MLSAVNFHFLDFLFLWFGFRGCCFCVFLRWVLCINNSGCYRDKPPILTLLLSNFPKPFQDNERNDFPSPLAPIHQIRSQPSSTSRWSQWRLQNQRAGPKTNNFNSPSQKLMDSNSSMPHDHDHHVLPQMRYSVSLHCLPQPQECL